MTNNNVNGTNNVPMPKATKIAIAVIISVAVLIGASVIYFMVQDKKASELAQIEMLKKQETQALIDEQAKIEKQKELELWAEKRLEEMKAEAEKAEAEKSIEQQQDNKPHTETKTETDKGIEYTPEYTKPEPPPPPKIDEEQKTKPTKPEYKPEDVTPPPTKPTTPKDGTRNDKGEIYIEGFGWVPPSAGVKGEVIDNSGWEDSERVGH